MEQNRKTNIKRIIAVIAAIFAIAASFLCGFFVKDCVNGKEINTNNEILKYIEKYGVFDTETLELKKPDITEITKNFVENLNDDYAHYYSKEEYQKIRENSYGAYKGVGISCFTQTLSVYRVAINSPAYFAGIKEKDVLVGAKYGDAEKTFSDYSEFEEFLQSVPEGEDFILTLKRNEEFVKVEIAVREYEITYVYYKDRDCDMAFLSETGSPELTEIPCVNSELNQDTAYISLYQFEGNAASELSGAIDYMLSRGKSKLILDLRYNGGGYMSVLEDVAALLINVKNNSSSVITYALDSSGEYTPYTAPRNKFKSGIAAISVIANEYTASASECLIGAMLYYKNAFDKDCLIIENDLLTEGTAKTYGKGIMQTTFPLSDGGALKITTAVIYQPDKTTCIHNKGITTSGENAILKKDDCAIERAQNILSSK